MEGKFKFLDYALSENELKEKVVNYKKYANNVFFNGWVQCFTVGKRVSQKEAMKVLGKLDRAFITTHSNDIDWQKQRDSLLGQDELMSYGVDIKKIYKEKFPNYEHIFLNYFSTEMGDSDFVRGPNGWMHPRGYIWNTFNIGKYPTLDEILSDLVHIANEFPFIEMVVIIMDDAIEIDVRHPKIGILVNKGNVTLLSATDAVTIANEYLSDKNNVIYNQEMDFKTAIERHYYYHSNHPLSIKMMSDILYETNK